jgi:hypothetical protein
MASAIWRKLAAAKAVLISLASSSFTMKLRTTIEMAKRPKLAIAPMILRRRRCGADEADSNAMALR